MEISPVRPIDRINKLQNNKKELEQPKKHENPQKNEENNQQQKPEKNNLFDIKI